MNDVFDITPKQSDNEIFKDIIKKDNVRIEKILSYGQVSPENEPYIQAHDEWVVVLDGKAKLKLDNQEYILEKGQHLFIPKNTKHWVTYTANPTVWLAVHIG